MTANGVDAGLLDIGGEEPGGVLKPEFRAGVCYPEHSEDGDDRDDRYGDDHLHGCEPVMLPGCSSFAAHCGTYLRVHPEQQPFRLSLFGFLRFW